MDQIVASARNATQAGKQFASSSSGQLARIEVLVTVGYLLVSVLVLSNSRRRHHGGALLRLLVWGAFMFNYPNELFVVWACFLLLLGTADTMTAFSFNDSSQQTRSMMNQALYVVYLLFLILYYKGQLRGTFLVSLFLLWSYSWPYGPPGTARPRHGRAWAEARPGKKTPSKVQFNTTN
ncbi:hypothetical protein [Oryza sativa Japonica Group]|uniref:DUF4220 domain-containing protein n=2 Tax=Oryza sativa subsp. japonica TaxID=39947 RepID=Q5ZEP8_ORYSJ|nr:hypothetical protein [Oryza sativa Japonica Group]BAD61483.1 hypothetical protein [Oryza sativa Japonica Group]